MLGVVVQVLGLVAIYRLHFISRALSWTALAVLLVNISVWAGMVAKRRTGGIDGPLLPIVHIASGIGLLLFLCLSLIIHPR